MNALPPSPFRPRAAALQTEVLRQTVLNGAYRDLLLRAPAPLTEAMPGQFFQLQCPAPPGEAPFLRRPMSLYAADAEAGTIGFLYKVTGAGTRGLAMLAPGDTLDVMGPLGRGFRLDPDWRHIVVVGRGAGLATLAPLARAARRIGIGVTAILSARRPELVVSGALFRAESAQVVAVTDSDGSSDPVHVGKLLDDLVRAERCDALFTCGSARLLRLLQGIARAHGLPGQVALEQQMACGLGMCFCCVRDFAVRGAIVHNRVCWDGPVFDLREAVA